MLILYGVAVLTATSLTYASESETNNKWTMINISAKKL